MTKADLRAEVATNSGLTKQEALTGASDRSRQYRRGAQFRREGGAPGFWQFSSALKPPTAGAQPKDWREGAGPCQTYPLFQTRKGAQRADQSVNSLKWL